MRVVLIVTILVWHACKVTLTEKNGVAIYSSALLVMNATELKLESLFAVQKGHFVRFKILTARGMFAGRGRA